MTKPGGATPADEPQRDPFDLTMVRDADWLLALIVRNTEAVVSKIPLTLAVKGILVTGILANQAQFAEALRPADEKDDPDTFRRAAAADDLPIFIHLRDASYVIGGRRVPTTGSIFWRGRLSEVDGFNFGALYDGDSTADPSA